MSNEKQQTAVEWFFEQLTEVDYNCINKTFLQNNNSLAGYRLRELFEQAKEKEKEQNQNYLKKYFEWHKSMGFFSHQPKDIIEFNETYGGNK